METIHKKNGRLHIYVRQDKYKGEIKSHNFVGRTYIDGKQKVLSSGTPDLEKAIPILEKWFDELQLKKNENIPVIEQIVQQNNDNSNGNDAARPPIDQKINDITRSSTFPRRA